MALHGTPEVHKVAVTVLVRGGGASLANAFLTVLTKGVSPGPSPTFPFAWIPAPTLFSHRGCRRSGLGRPSSKPAPGLCASPRRPRAALPQEAPRVCSAFTKLKSKLLPFLRGVSLHRPGLGLNTKGLVASCCGFGLKTMTRGEDKGTGVPPCQATASGRTL